MACRPLLITAVTIFRRFRKCGIGINALNRYFQILADLKTVLRAVNYLLSRTILRSLYFLFFLALDTMLSLFDVTLVTNMQIQVQLRDKRDIAHLSLSC